jgi:hypothetical protein
MIGLNTLLTGPLLLGVATLILFITHLLYLPRETVSKYAMSFLIQISASMSTICLLSFSRPKRRKLGLEGVTTIHGNSLLRAKIARITCQMLGFSLGDKTPLR